MSEPNESQDTQLDEQVAQFADKVLAGQGDASGSHSTAPNDSELAQLQKTILRLHSASQAAQPTPTTTARIRQYVVAEWAKQKAEKERKAKAEKRASWWPLQKNTLAWGGAALAILILTLLVLPNTDPAGNLNGTALDSTMAVMIGLGVLALGALIVWLTRRK